MARVAAMPLTAAQEILFGAYDLDQAGSGEFSEWDLTVATWRRNPNRFGCRGYESEYPDHKRVMMEIMGTTKKDNPIRRGWIEKVRPNTYRLTKLGLTEAERLGRNRDTDRQSTRSPQAIYDAVAPLYRNSVFRKHSRDRDEPRMWLGAASFLQLTKSDPQHLEDRLRATETAIQNAIDWLDENNADHIQRGVSGGSEAISRSSLMQLKTFHETIIDRFSGQIEAVKKSKR
jgi:hypothetical protein